MQVPREFKNTLEQEIGLDELRKPRPMDTPPTYQQAPPQQQEAQQQQQQQQHAQDGAPDARAYTANDYMRVTKEQDKALVPGDLRRDAEAAAWGCSAPPKPPADNETNEPVIEPERSRNGSR